MRPARALPCMIAALCFLAAGCEGPQPEGQPTLTTPGRRVTAIASAGAPAVRIEGAGGRTVMIKIHNAAGELIATRPQAIPPGHWYQFQPKLLPGTYTITVEIGGAPYGSCNYVVPP